MSEERQDPYAKTVRKIKGKTEFSFYENSGDDDAEIFLNGDDLSADPLLSVTKKQIVSTGLCPARKYATVDGHTLPDGTAYLSPDTVDTVFPLWSKSVCGADKTFAAAERPIYRLQYVATRPVGLVMIIGDEKWAQGPTAYRLHVCVPQAESPYAGTAASPDPSYTEKSVSSPTTAATEEGYTRYTFSLSATDAESVKQCVLLDRYYPAIRLELEIEKWSASNTTAKIMFFSDDIRISCEGNELQEISVLEEKTDSVASLSYGITSNSCAVKVKNTGNRFVMHPDLLKKNRIVRPFLREEEDGTWRALGRYFSDSWEVSSTSEFVSCKAYDVLYNLQKMNLCYPMERDEDGNYAMDGAVNGSNATARAVFEKIFRLVNAQRKANGIYGADIDSEIDDRLQNVTFSYVCLGFDTAWNMLQTAANAAQCFVYVDRAGKVQVRRDDFAASVPTPSVAVTPSNSFSYNLPTMSHAVVNRVTVPYALLTDEGKEDDDEFTVQPKDFSYDEDGNVVLDLSLKNFYAKIARVESCDRWFNNGTPISDDRMQVGYDQIKITLSAAVTGTQYIKIVPVGEGRQKIGTADYVYNGYESQKRNGVVEFSLACGKMIFGASAAASVCGQIVAKYGDGLPYIETEWRGTPLLALGDGLTSYSRKDPLPVVYECLSNEFSYDGGLRVKTKARKISASG